MGNVGVAALAGLFVPFFVSFLKDVTWSTKVKQGVCVAVSVLVAVGITAIDKGVNLTDWKVLVSNLAVIFSVAQIFYNQYFGGMDASKLGQFNPMVFDKASFDQALKTAQESAGSIADRLSPELKGFSEIG